MEGTPDAVQQTCNKNDATLKKNDKNSFQPELRNQSVAAAAATTNDVEDGDKPKKTQSHEDVSSRDSIRPNDVPISHEKSSSSVPDSLKNWCNVSPRTLSIDDMALTSVSRSNSDVNNADDNQIRLRLSDFASKHSSRKSSSCSTPISTVRDCEVDYPSPNFIRPIMARLATSGLSASVEEVPKLSIRLHYNPVMDEWISLSDDYGAICQSFHDAETLFSLHQSGQEEVIHVGKFLSSMEVTGILRSDPRLKQMMNSLSSMLQEKGGNGSCSIENLKLDKQSFIDVTMANISLISRAFKRQLVIPEFSDFTKKIFQLFQKCKDNTIGQVADYIPQLAKYDANSWGVSICTVDGQRYSTGDTTAPFTLQSCSKPFTYAVCLNELGSDIVHQYVGHEPSGRMFNELSLDYSNKPHNPLLNSGAIMSSAILLGLVKTDMKMSEKFEFVMNYLRRMAGGEYLGYNSYYYCTLSF